MKLFNKVLVLFCAITLGFLTFTSVANDQIQQSTQHNLNEAELEQLLAPIALYPDSILTHILIASTYPLEIVQGQRWLDKHPNMDTAAIAEGVENEDWDASVKALLPFPRVIKRLNNDLVWTQKLGDAFLQDENQVLASIQKLRHKADLAGSLDQMDNMDVSRNNNTIIIQPIQPNVVYVPYYDSRDVYGDWYWQNYPPVYWNISNRHHRYFQSNIHSRFYWNSGITISFNYFFNAFQWHQHRIVEVKHYAPRFRNSYSYGYKLNRHHTKVWRHNPKHRRGVFYHNKQVKQRYYSRHINSPKDNYSRNKAHSKKPYRTKIVRQNHVNKVYKKRALQEPRMKNFREGKAYRQYKKFNKALATTRRNKVNTPKNNQWRKHVVVNNQKRYVAPRKIVKNNSYANVKRNNVRRDIKLDRNNLRNNHSKNKNHQKRYRR